MIARLALVLLLGLPAFGWAQDVPAKPKRQRPHRTGLWGEISLGIGSIRVACTGCADPEFTPGSAGLVRLGGTLTDKVMLGWESAGFTHEVLGGPEDSTTQSQIETISIVVLWFPWRSGLFLKGGVGIAQGRFTVATGATVDSTEGTGIGMTLGLGWDVPISRKFAITANAASIIAAPGDFVLPGRRIEDLIGSVYQISVGLTFR